MEALLNTYARLLKNTKDKYIRYLYEDIAWNNRLIALVGPKGTGKTTMLLQHIKKTFSDTKKALYVSLDHIWFSKNSLLDLADRFNAYGGTHLFVDEVHRYPNWATEIKNIYDGYPDLHVVFTGSSMLEIYKASVDFSRRAITYELDGLSFREFLLFEGKLQYAALSLNDILKNHRDIAIDITSKIKVLPEFKKYLEYGYYPFYREDLHTYPIRIEQIVNKVLDNDLPAIESIEYSSIIKIKKLLVIISGLVPFVPNIVELSRDIETSRNSTVKYLYYLDKAGLINSINTSNKGLNAMNKPDKIYLDNTNLLYALNGSNVNVGCIRETFFANQLQVKHTVNTAKAGDFTINDKFVFEVGGRSKTFTQIKNVKNAYVAADETEVGFGSKIPLWLFGMLY
ncbi:MAG: AAA family ATPase [Prevotellaceae bacterium]|jgi:predicted AAA+ superfamily ATPase|nr:AAA family ATPase [Prevotellaceae bacterium]